RGTTRMLLHQVLHEEPRSPRSLNDKIPRDLETICLKAMAKEPARRYESARELAEDLVRWSKGEPILARPVGELERLARWCRRNPVVAGLTAGIAAALLIGTVVSVGFATYANRKAVDEHAAREQAEIDRARANANEERATQKETLARTNEEL